MIALIAAAAFVISFQFTRMLLDPTLSLSPMDHPNERSLHAHPTPRSGGLAVFCALFTAAAAAGVIHGFSRDIVWLASGSLAVAIVSFVDDHIQVHPGLRLVVHAAAASLLVLGDFALRDLELPGFVLEVPMLLSVPLTVLFVVWMVNLYNFMDGMDGFAGGMAVIGFGCFALMAWRAGHGALVTASALTVFAVAGFLVFNFPPARIFMGDVGASLLGFVAAALSLWADRESVFPLWISVLVFSPFVVDATVTLLARAWRRERVWKAHRMHYYQRLVRHGWSHRFTVLWEYALMLACAACAVVAQGSGQGGQWAMLVGSLVLFSVLLLLVPHIERSSRITQRPTE